MFSGIISFNRSKTSYDKGKLKNHSSRQEQTLPLLYFPNISNIQNIQTFKNSQAYIKVERILQWTCIYLLPSFTMSIYFITFYASI